MEKTKKDYFLFDTKQFVEKTNFWTNEERGIYIDLLCYLNMYGKVSSTMVKIMCNGKKYPRVIDSFTLDTDGNITGE
jgi:hypothetical protein